MLVSLFGRGGLWLYWLREEFGTPGCICTKSSVGVLGGQVSGLEILLGEGGDVELGARTSKHISLFVFDPLTLNSLSLYFVLCIASFILPYHSYAWLCLALIHISYIYMLGCVCLCASLVLNHESFI